VNGEPDGLAAGESRDGFEVISVNLPGVTTFRCRGNLASSPLPHDLPAAIEDTIVNLPQSSPGVGQTIGPAIERPDDPVPVLLRRVVRNFRLAIRSSGLPDARAAVEALDRVGEAADANSATVRMRLDALSALLPQNPVDRWTRELVGALRQCIAFVSARLEA
jgi:hypothetical protein